MEGAQAVTVHFVGAGPGAPDLLTLRAARLISEASVILYAGSLIPPEVLGHTSPTAELVDTAQLDLDRITELLSAAHAAGNDVVRLCSGDPAVYSAIAEQSRRLTELDIPWEIHPGVPAFSAAAAALRQELTVPTVGQTVVLSRVAVEATPMPPGEELQSLARTNALLALHLATGHAQKVQDELIPHYGGDCPVAIVEKASWPDQQILRGTLSELASLIADAGIKRTAIIFVGQVLDPSPCRDSHLYSKNRDRSVPL